MPPTAPRHRIAALFSALALAGCTAVPVPRTVAADPGLPAVEVNGVRLHAFTFGAPGRPVVEIGRAHV